MKGYVKCYFDNKNFGFIMDEDGIQRFFHITEVIGRTPLKRGAKVEFQPAEGIKGKTALKVSVVNKSSIISKSIKKNSINILKEIAKWKLEAKFDNVDRYFYKLEEIDNILNGEKCFVIGRKGTGKTAISEYIYKQKAHNIFSQKLTFKEFPFNDLYKMKDDKYRYPNQYITLWKNLIYTSTLRLLMVNESLDSELKDLLRKVYIHDPINYLHQKSAHFFTQKVGASVLGTGGNVSFAEKTKNDISWIEQSDILEKLILQNIDDSYYYIIFDELDDDYKDVFDLNNYNNYMALLTSLFKAVQDVRSAFHNKQKNIIPIIFLRDDIYDQIKDSDKTKWNDFSLELNWDQIEIKNLLAFRLSKTFGIDAPIKTFDEVWNNIFSAETIEVNNSIFINREVFDYISQFTYMRPRDYIEYLKICSEMSIKNNENMIGHDVVLKSSEKFSTHLFTELVDEIHGIFPEIKEIFNIFRIFKTANFASFRFIHEYEKAITNGKIPKRDPEFVLNTLFTFNVVGNERNNGQRIFRYTNRSAVFNLNDNICIHKGLCKALLLT